MSALLAATPLHLGSGAISDLGATRPPEDAEHVRLQALIDREPSTPGEGIADALDRLCRCAAHELRLAGAAVTLVPTAGAHVVSAASNPATRQHEDEQFGVGEGPTQDVFSSQSPVEVTDLERTAAGRWPGYAPAASAAGVRAVVALPLQLGAVTFGVLTLSGPDPRVFNRAEMRTALIFAELATQLLIDNSMEEPTAGLDPDHHAAMAIHGHIYQAQGMTMVDLGVPLPEALARMRAHAYATNQDLADLATDIIAGRTVLPADQ
jgi:transcriptional regulator with GAF, ATPase, and Fis domain